MKIAIVLLDDFVTERGDFGKLGIELLEKVVKYGEYTIFDYIRGLKFPDASKFDLIYLTGSRKDAFAEDEFTNVLINHVQQAIDKCKLLGICYGHQIVARAYGLIVKRNPVGWEMGKTVVTCDTGCFVINEMHMDIVELDLDALEKSGLDVVGFSEKCEVQGLKSRDGHVLTLQGHPEFDDDVTLSMVRKKKDQVGAAYVEDCERRSGCGCGGETDSVELIIAQFLNR